MSDRIGISEKEHEKLKAKIKKRIEQKGINFDEAESADANLLKGVLVYAVSEVADYDYIGQMLGNLINSFDEHVEIHETATWFSYSGKEPSRIDLLIDKYYQALDSVTTKQTALFKRAVEHLKNVLTLIFISPDDIQEKVLGITVNMPDKQIKKWISDYIESYFLADEYEYIAQPEQCGMRFIGELSKELELYKNKQEEGNK